MKILLVYPKHPSDFWSFKHALNFVYKKAANPPMGLLTVAAMLPKEWEKKVLDMNIADLDDKDIEWADFVFISALYIQGNYVKEIVARCKKLGVKIVAGGPLFTICYKEFENIDYLVLNEAEITLPLFLEDLNNNCPKHIYRTEQFANLKDTPIPMWELIDLKKYLVMGIQYSRGCPFDCEFCEQSVLFGRKSRVKSKSQIIAELDNLYSRGWRGAVFFVDDNFIGNKQELKKEILPAIIQWMDEKDSPFAFSTQVSINISDDADLMKQMARAGFDTLFIGIETPNEESLTECSKLHNKNRDLIGCVKKIQRFGFEVQGGFIVGFDSDPISIFESQFQFIQQSGIVTAMVNILKAPHSTRLYHRLKNENRLVEGFFGGSICSTNFIPKMGYDTLISGFKKLISKIYSPNFFYARVKKCLEEFKKSGGLKTRRYKVNFNDIMLLFKIIFRIGIIAKERFHLWSLFFWTLFKCPRYLPFAFTLVVIGYNFQKTLEEYI